MWTHQRGGHSMKTSDNTPSAAPCGDTMPVRLARLEDQRKLLLREVQPQDRALIQQGFDALSVQSRHQRFHAPRRALSEAELRAITDPADETHIVIGALTHDGDGAYRIPVGLARFIRPDAKAKEAECAVTVVDAFQDLGAGTALFCALLRRAHMCGITQLTALVQRNNHAVRRLFGRFGSQERAVDTGQIDVVLNVETARHAA